MGWFKKIRKKIKKGTRKLGKWTKKNARVIVPIAAGLIGSMAGGVGGALAAGLAKKLMAGKKISKLIGTAKKMRAVYKHGEGVVQQVKGRARISRVVTEGAAFPPNVAYGLREDVRDVLDIVDPKPKKVATPEEKSKVWMWILGLVGVGVGAAVLVDQNQQKGRRRR